jgi:hypothetical protein
MFNTHNAVADRSPTTRSRVANRPLHTRGVDGRTASARRFRDIAQSLVDDLGGAVSEAQMLLVRQAAMTSLTVEKLQAQIVSGGDADPELLIRLANTQTRSLQELGLGLKRGRGAATPSGSTALADYLARLNQEADEEVDVESPGDETGGLQSAPATEHAAGLEDIAPLAEALDP